ncbi:DUF3891 family protein [Lichenibacterium dinghuense]|uniref:DUF3891 family protein n=1 Tax=Lichenibacterium dinghuense TaxID=2895977 RepID=UPI001F2642DB|nr:DUF3891 family protein [Lichenibacterium sp. 6Y81]
MLLRREAHRRIAIPQPAHAGLSGQLAAAWGNAEFAAPRPEAVLAAALHDIGWAAWERAPTRDPETGWPRQFPDVSKLIHVGLWRDGVATARLYGRWPALLVSLHADTIYSRHYDPRVASAEEREAVSALLDDQHALQAELIASLRADPAAGDASDEAVEAARLFVAAVDELSLVLCWGLDGPRDVCEVPSRSGRTATLTVAPAGDAVAVAPWPFAARRLAVAADGKALTAPFPSDDALRRGLRDAPAVTLSAVLVPG